MCLARSALFVYALCIMGACTTVPEPVLGYRSPDADIFIEWTREGINGETYVIYHNSAPTPVCLKEKGLYPGFLHPPGTHLKQRAYVPDLGEARLVDEPLSEVMKCRSVVAS